MLKNRKKNKRIIREEKDEHNFLLYVPEITHNDWEVVEGKVLLNFKVTNPITKFAGFLAKKEPKRDMLLDSMCTSAWLQIDGKRSIYEIAKIQASKTDDEFNEDLRRLIIFIKYISKRGWVRYKEVKSSYQ